MVMAAWPWNPPPVDGYSYLVVEVEIENTGDREMAVDFDDFGFVTEARRVWKSQGLFHPILRWTIALLRENRRPAGLPGPSKRMPRGY
ncbi:MAG: hypothetical protein R2839_05585 [Thermomicrobiales bacterium]